jgi:hypothetical protein
MKKEAFDERERETFTLAWGEGQTPPQLIASIALILISYNSSYEQERACSRMPTPSDWGTRIW